MDEESFELLSSMSPKVKHCQKHFRKGTSVLALRKSLRRSIIYDKSIHTVNNDNLNIAEISSTTTTESDSIKPSNLHKKLINPIPIIIHDSGSDSESNELISTISSQSRKSLKISRNDVNKKRSLVKHEACDPLPKEKFENIKQWIDNVNQSKVQDNTAYSLYSELSTIYGDNKNLITEKTGRAVNSTVVGSTSIHFDELFKHKTDKKSDNSDESFDRKDFKNVIKDDVIDESYDNQSTKSSKNSRESKNDKYKYNVRMSNSTNSDDRSVPSSRKKSNLHKPIRNSKGNKMSNKKSSDAENDSDNSFCILNESLGTRLHKNKSQTNSTTEADEILNEAPKENEYLKNNVDIPTKNEHGSDGTCDNELASMLDDLYGDKWREKRDHVLPKTEPRKRIPTQKNVYEIQSERKPKYSITHKNPYLETEKQKCNNLLKSLQKSRMNNYMESPVIKRLNEFCDSDTESKDSESEVQPRVRLNFEDSDCENDDPKARTEFEDDGTKSKYFKNKERPSKKTETKAEKDKDSDKENLDESLFLGQSLEERIRKKINGIKTSSGGTKKKNLTASVRKKPLTSTTNINLGQIGNSVEKEERKKVDDKLSSGINSSSSDDEWDKQINKIVHEKKQVNGKYSFLASLSVNVPIYQCDMSARIYRNNFKLYKEQLLAKLFKLYNEKIFENALPDNTLLEWNDRMRGTAGFCYCKKITRRTGVIERTARIVLSTKVIDAAYRLRDTLVHEMCHAATWIVNCVSDGHGPYWKSWAYKAMQTFPELPPIKRCHDYVINTKYTYKCTGCGYSIGRHSKSLDIERKRCGHCYGKFEVLLNKVSKKGETKSVPATPKKEVTGFALFVKENYGTYKQGNLKHADVMKLLGQKFQELKLKPS